MVLIVLGGTWAARSGILSLIGNLSGLYCGFPRRRTPALPRTRGSKRNGRAAAWEGERARGSLTRTYRFQSHPGPRTRNLLASCERRIDGGRTTHNVYVSGACACICCVYNCGLVVHVYAQWPAAGSGGMGARYRWCPLRNSRV
ncbi:hypothetical protein C8R46DRAFT_348253 [Mycena filopes]|nr:hypothetical protein C8R46DRAFT_348253 [Mycena filopes]